MSLRLAFSVCLLTVAPAAAQLGALWAGGASGNWGSSANWDCTNNGGPSFHCVPSAGYVVNSANANITFDVDANIGLLFGFGSLTLSNKSLTATNAGGIGTFSNITLLNSASINSPSLSTNGLTVQSSSITANTLATTANITNGTVSALTIGQQLIASGSNLGTNASLNIAAASSMSSSTLSGTLFVSQGGSLLLDSASSLTSTQTFIAGGSVTVQGASQLTASGFGMSVGFAPGASSLTVDGTGSALNLSGIALELGQAGNATVTVSNNGQITGSNGSVFVGLGDSSQFVTDSKMFVEAGGTVNVGSVTVSGSSGGSTGSLQVFGQDSALTVTNELGLFAGGTVDVNSQGSVTAGSLTIETGQMTIENSSTLNLSSASNVLIAPKGTGSLTLQTGGSGLADGPLFIGGVAAAHGTMTIDGNGTKWQGGSSVTVGDFGTGTLNIRNFGVFENVHDAGGVSAIIAAQPFSTGTVNVMNSGDWQAHGSLQIGAAGTGALNIQSGGTVESDDAVIGLDGHGTVTVDGTKSQWTVNGGLTIGSQGAATLTVINGGAVTSTSGIIGETHNSTSAGVTVAGNGSKWLNSGNLIVGQDGTGTLDVLAGGKVTSVGGVLGANFNSSGTVTVNGFNSMWDNTGTLTVAPGGQGNLTVDSGGSVTAASATIGGTVTVLGSGSSLKVQGAVSVFSVGSFSSAELMVEGGGSVTSASGTIGGAGTGLVAVEGGGSSWVINGAGTLTIGAGGTLEVNSGGLVSAGTIDVEPGGTLDAPGGAVFGDIVNNGGTVSPGDATGILHVTGNYTQNSGSLLFEIDGLGPAQFDQLVISGLATFTGGTLDIVFGNGFLPVGGESFDLITAGGGLSFTGVTVVVTGLSAGLQFMDALGPGGFQLSFVAAQPQSAPEPEPGYLVMTALAALWWRRFHYKVFAR